MHLHVYHVSLKINNIIMWSKLENKSHMWSKLWKIKYICEVSFENILHTCTCMRRKLISLKLNYICEVSFENKLYIHVSSKLLNKLHMWSERQKVFTYVQIRWVCKIYGRLGLISPCIACRGGVEVAGWTADWTIRVRFPAYHHCVWALWWQGGKRRLLTFRCLCRGRLGMLKTPSCPWRWVQV